LDLIMHQCTSMTMGDQGMVLETRTYLISKLAII
jgi:hypothetical protein